MIWEFLFGIQKNICSEYLLPIGILNGFIIYINQYGLTIRLQKTTLLTFACIYLLSFSNDVFLNLLSHSLSLFNVNFNEIKVCNSRIGIWWNIYYRTIFYWNYFHTSDLNRFLSILFIFVYSESQRFFSIVFLADQKVWFFYTRDKSYIILLSLKVSVRLESISVSFIYYLRIIFRVFPVFFSWNV